MSIVRDMIENVRLDKPTRVVEATKPDEAVSNFRSADASAMLQIRNKIWL